MRRQRAVAPSPLLFLLFSSSCFSLPASRRGPASSRVSPFASSPSNHSEESCDDKALVDNRMVRRKLQVEDRSRHAFVELFSPSLEKRWHSGEEAAERIGKTKKQERNRGGRKLWKQVLVRVRRCKLQVYRGKTSRRRRWSVVRAGRAGPTPILIKRSHKRLTNWLYVRRFIGVPEQDVKMFQS